MVKQCAQLKVDAKAWQSELFFVIGAGWKIQRQKEVMNRSMQRLSIYVRMKQLSTNRQRGLECGSTLCLGLLVNMHQRSDKS